MIGVLRMGTVAALALVAAFQSAPPPPAPGQGKLIVYGDMALFQPPGHPENCILRNRFKRGEPVNSAYLIIAAAAILSLPLLDPWLR